MISQIPTIDLQTIQANTDIKHPKMNTHPVEYKKKCKE